ncbi:MAG: hypothetical protein WC683_15545 [bacterium]
MAKTVAKKPITTKTRNSTAGKTKKIVIEINPGNEISGKITRFPGRGITRFPGRNKAR